MDGIAAQKLKISNDGFAVIENIYTNYEVNTIASIIEKADYGKATSRQKGELFAMRRFLKEVPATIPFIFNNSLKNVICNLFGQDHFVVKSIYFDKPGSSNWFVAYHQDITIAVCAKHERQGFINWTKKQDQFAVQPPLEILENNFTIRIHLDDTDENNGALKVIPGSHANGINKTGFNPAVDEEHICQVQKGGIMIMRPLLMHASGRTLNNKNRRAPSTQGRRRCAVRAMASSISSSTVST